MIQGIKARLKRHRERLFSRRTREQHAKAKKPAIGLANLTRRALFSGGVAAMVTAQVGPGFAGWWTRFAPVAVAAGLDVLSYQPGVHYAVGRTLLTVPRKAVTEINRVVGFASNQYAVPTTAPAGANGFFQVTFVANKTAFPFDMYPGAGVTVASESTLNTSNVIYVNGKVASYDFPSGTLVINVPRSGAGWGGKPGVVAKQGDVNGGGAGGVYQFATSAGQHQASGLVGFSGDGVQRTDWTLTFHMPPNLYPHYSHNYLIAADPATGDYPLLTEALACQNWDMSGVPCAMTGAGLTNGNPFIMAQSTLEQANRQIGGRGQVTFLGVGGLTNARFINCDMPWTWRKWSIQVTVTADTASGQTIPISGSLLENPGFLLPSETRNLVKPYSIGGIQYRYRVINEGNPKSLTTCYVSDCVDNTSVTLTGLIDNGAGGVLAPIVGSAYPVKAGDVLRIVPEPTQTNFVSGAIGLIDLCNMDNLQDFWNPINILLQTSDGNGGQLPASNVITRSIINNTGAVNAHDDVSQMYNWQGSMEMSFLKINFGFKPGDEAVAANIRCNNPREMCIWANNMGWNGETRIHDIMMVTIQGWQLGSFQRVSNSFILPIKGAWANGVSGQTRISFAGMPNGGTVTAGQELWTLRGTGTALDGNFLAQNAVPLVLSGGTGILNASCFGQFSVQAAAQGATTLTAASSVNTAQGNLAVPGQGCVLVTAGSAATGPNQVIGYIASMSAGTIVSGTAINLGNSGGIPAALSAGATVYVLPWVDMAGTPTGVPLGGNEKVSASVNDNQITVADTSRYAVGMGVQGYDPGNNINQQADVYATKFVPDDTYVKSIDSPTKLTLTRPVSNTLTNKWIAIAPVLRGNKTGASYFYNMFVGNNVTGLATEFTNRTGQGYEAFFDSVFGGLAAWNVFDFTRQALKFYINDPAYTDGATYTGQLGSVYSASNIYAYNQPLGAPNNVKVTPLGGGQIKIEFDAVPGAKAHTYTLDGKLFSLDPKNNQASSNGTIVSGVVISGLSGVVNVGVAPLTGANDIGVPVIRGAVSALIPVSVAA